MNSWFVTLVVALFVAKISVNAHWSELSFLSFLYQFYHKFSIRNLVNYILVLSINVGKWRDVNAALYFLILASRTGIC
jgi:multisubunit Na+/H+ antiporter MnhB subunit